MRMPRTQDDAVVVAERLHLATGFLQTESGWVSDRLSGLAPQLRSFRDDEIELELSLRDRQGTAQRVTLECWINRRPRTHLVVTSSVRDLSAALGEVRNELVRQLDVAKTRTDPRRHRALTLVPALHEQD
jgi:ribosome-associated translation inhibitor RaiA